MDDDKFLSIRMKWQYLACPFFLTRDVINDIHNSNPINVSLYILPFNYWNSMPNNHICWTLNLIHMVHNLIILMLNHFLSRTQSWQANYLFISIKCLSLLLLNCICVVLNSMANNKWQTNFFFISLDILDFVFTNIS